MKSNFLYRYIPYHPPSAAGEGRGSSLFHPLVRMKARSAALGLVPFGHVGVNGFSEIDGPTGHEVIDISEVTDRFRKGIGRVSSARDK